MPVDDIVKLCVILSLVVLPALAITARFALKPIVDAILRLKEGGMLPGSQNLAAGQEVPLLASEVRHLRAEMAQLQQSVAQLQEAETFHRSLGERAAPPQIAPSADA
jgi:outer membrane murein-binding lipoprotein Lpp